MEQDRYWKEFAASGRIEDYLAYAAHKEKTPTAKGSIPESVGNVKSTRRVESAQGGRKNEQRNRTEIGDAFHAGFLYGDRDGTKPDACR